MRQRYRLFRRSSGTFFIEDRATRRQESLRTKDKESAARLFHAKNEAYQQPALNLQIARAYLMASDPAIATRTWQQVMDEILRMKHGETQVRWTMAIQDHAFDLVRNTTVIGTTAEQFLRVLEAGTVSTNVYLRRIHNFALDMNWTPAPIILKRQWPPVRHKEKRAITPEEHQQIIQREHNPELRAFYELLWHLGGSQTDVATLQRQDVDREQRTIAYSRRKTGVPALIRFGEAVAKILAARPNLGPLFPRLGIMHEKHRAKLFNRRCKLLNIQGVSLHSYRYSWAERAKTCGYPERFAQQALGHGSKAVHRAYAKKAQVKVPSLEEYEKAQEDRKVVEVMFQGAEGIEPTMSPSRQGPL